MPDSKEYDEVAKTVSKIIDDWGKAIEKIGKQLKDVTDELEKIEKLKKEREDLAKDADKASKELNQKLFSVKIPPKADPQQMVKLPDFITKNISKNGVKLGDGVSVKPDIDIDLKKMQLKGGGVTLTIDW